MTVAGVDLGATTVRAAIADDNGDLLAAATEPTPRGSGEAVADAIEAVLVGAADRAGVQFAAVDAVGIGSMGPLDTAGGAVVGPPNLPDVDRIPVVDAVRRRYGGPVALHNDAVAGAIGERFAGDERLDDLAYVTISTGIGVGAVVDGQVLSGATGNAAELGHVTLEPESDQTCGCGGTGHWEALCSGANVASTVRALAAETDRDTEMDLADLDARSVYEAAGSDPLATYAVERLADWNARGVATVVHAYDPAHVRLGGGVATNNPDSVVGAIRRRLPDHVVTEVPTVGVAANGENAVLRGAVASVLEERPTAGKFMNDHDNS